MTILEAIRAEERKLEKQLSKLQGELEGIRNAAKALGHSAKREAKTIKKRVLSAAGRAKIAAAARKRWAKVRAQAKKSVGQEGVLPLLSSGCGGKTRKQEPMQIEGEVSRLNRRYSLNVHVPDIGAFVLGSKTIPASSIATACTP